MKEMEGKTCLITGATSGIGSSAALKTTPKWRSWPVRQGQTRGESRHTRGPAAWPVRCHLVAIGQAR